MKEEILDEIDNNDLSNKIHLKRIFQFAIGTICLLLLLEKMRAFLLWLLVNEEEVIARAIGGIIGGVVIVMTILFSYLFDKIQPKLSKTRIVVYCGVLIFLIEFVFKMLQNLLFFKNGFDLDYMGITKVSLLVGTLSILIANVSIHKFRKEKTIVPAVLMLVIWLLISLLTKFEII